MSQSETSAKEIAHRFFDGLDEHNPDIFDDLIAEDITTGIYRSGSGEDVTGRDGMKSLWKEYWNAFPDLNGESTDLIHEDNRVAVFRRETGTHEGNFRGIEPTETEITFEYSGYVEVDDDKIVHAYFHGDMLSLLEQLGIESPIPNPSGT